MNQSTHITLVRLEHRALCEMLIEASEEVNPEEHLQDTFYLYNTQKFLVDPDRPGIFWIQRKDGSGSSGIDVATFQAWMRARGYSVAHNTKYEFGHNGHTPPDPDKPKLVRVWVEDQWVWQPAPKGISVKALSDAALIVDWHPTRGLHFACVPGTHPYKAAGMDPPVALDTAEQIEQGTVVEVDPKPEPQSDED